MRILLVNYRYFISGGPERYMFNIKKVLEDHGHEVIPFSVHSSKNVETPYSRYFVEPIGSRDAVYFEECKKTPRVILQMLSRSIYSLKVKRAIQKEIDEVKPDMVYILHFVNKLSPSVIRGAKQKGLPVVVRLSDYFLLCPRFDFLCDRKICEDCLKKGYRSCLKKRCVKGSLFASAVRVISMKAHKLLNVYKDVDAFVTPTEFLKQKLAENGFDGQKIHCIPTFAPHRDSAEPSPMGDYGLYVGRIAEEKGVEVAVKAYEMLPDHRLKIVGDTGTDEAKRLMKYAEERKIRNVEFTGFQSGKALEKLYRESRFTVIPSTWYENLPNSAIESYRYGKPILCSSVGSMPETIIPDHTGLIFETGNAEALRDCVLRMDDADEVRRMSEECGGFLNRRFNEEAHYQALMAVMESARR